MSLKTKQLLIRASGLAVALTGLFVIWAALSLTSGVFMVAACVVGIVIVFSGSIGIITGTTMSFSLVYYAILEALSL